MASVMALVIPQKSGPAATFLGCCARASLGSIEGVIYGLTIQKVGKSFELRCPECTCLTGKIGLVRKDGLGIRLLCGVHPENFGEWQSESEMEREKLALAERIGLRDNFRILKWRDRTPL